MKKLLLPIIICLSLSIQLNAQEKSTKELKGDKYIFNYSYAKAVEAYTHTKNLTADGQRKLAESYHNINLNIQSEEAYAKLLNDYPAGIIPEDHYCFAMILKSNGKYELSNIQMDKFNSLKPADLRAQSYVATKNELPDLLKDNGLYKVGNQDVNSGSDDFGTSFYKDEIVFASTKASPKMVVRKDNWTGEPYLNMFVSKKENGQLKKPKIFDKGLDGRLHDGPASFNKEGTLIAFTRNHFKDKSDDKVVELQIYFSSYLDNKWTEAIPFEYNNTAYSVWHPSLSADGNTMYFASDMPGGFGQSDIYKTTKNFRGIWNKPENMGNKVNTEGDEMFPFYESKNRVLFFASNGRFGLGGLDIFICEIKDSDYGRIYNAGFPLNSQYDEFAFIVNDSMTNGYFSSNRVGGKGHDDIYTVTITKVLDIQKKINGITKDINQIAIPKTFVTLLNEKGKMIDTVTTKEDGAFTFLVDTDNKFKLEGKKEHYLKGDTATNTFGKELIVIADITLLTKTENIVKKLIPRNDLAVVLELNTIYFDLDKSTIRSDAKTELDKIVNIMNEYPEMVVELSSHADCRASEQYNQKLSDKRAKSSTNYIRKRITRPYRITGKGYGETAYSADCSCSGNAITSCSEVEYQNARKTEFIIIKTNDVVAK